MTGRTTFSHLLAALMIAGALDLHASTAPTASFFSINSPDHPRCWFVSADFDKLDQVLRWNEHDQSLCLDITYTLHGEWPIHEDPDLYNRFTVHFPAVRLNPVTRELYFRTPAGQDMRIGVLQPSVFGHRIALDSSVTVNAHRQGGVIDAALVINPPLQR